MFELEFPDQQEKQGHCDQQQQQRHGECRDCDRSLHPDKRRNRGRHQRIGRVDDPWPVRDHGFGLGDARQRPVERIACLQQMPDFMQLHQVVNVAVGHFALQQQQAQNSAERQPDDRDRGRGAAIDRPDCRHPEPFPCASAIDAGKSFRSGNLAFSAVVAGGPAASASGAFCSRGLNGCLVIPIDDEAHHCPMLLKGWQPGFAAQEPVGFRG
ncbi:hypothetical protein [Mesorhizobium sp.]|uniref:hypothetical protein n=1 Tax=Mesorhizobium sp. TaxID=1871066 RepID=UPI000FE4DD68|nr:hypothetical protein [Mesorhizobium sp.]RWM29340.1 MAG: hypothetical protein EOR74_06560 [Mesorhizobium sp.]RWM42352.1 MAG: hypothetical protein EOR75_00285 [Mesorhizobium sp.]TJV52810.1 MAG: hypothetical protein E5Y01_06235 [Mesorhizobium sp.]